MTPGIYISATKALYLRTHGGEWYRIRDNDGQYGSEPWRGSPVNAPHDRLRLLAPSDVADDLTAHARRLEGRAASLRALASGDGAGPGGGA